MPPPGRGATGPPPGGRRWRKDITRSWGKECWTVADKARAHQSPGFVCSFWHPDGATLPRPLPRNSGGPRCPGPCLGIPATHPNCHPDGARRATHGISNPEPLPSGGKGICLGVDHTKESLSFGRQPSLFKGRNQSWFHPLRTPSRPGAAAPGPQRGAANRRRFLRIPSTGRDAPTASCSVLPFCWHRVTFWEQGGSFVFAGG